LSVVFAVDSSGSVRTTDPNNLRVEAVVAFLQRLLPTDEAGIVSWNGEIEFSTGLTNDFGYLTEQASHIGSSGGGTNLNLGLETAISVLGTSTHGTFDPRAQDVTKKVLKTQSVKVIVLITDGEGSYTRCHGAPIGTAADALISVFTIGLSMQPGSTAELSLIDAAACTDMPSNLAIGMYFPSPDAEDIAAIFNDIYHAASRYAASAFACVSILLLLLCAAGFAAFLAGSWLVGQFARFPLYWSGPRSFFKRSDESGRLSTAPATGGYKRWKGLSNSNYLVKGSGSGATRRVTVDWGESGPPPSAPGVIRVAVAVQSGWLKAAAWIWWILTAPVALFVSRCRIPGFRTS
jgi:hypothetical protein